MKVRLLAVFADAPIVFFGVVFGVALIFRVGVGAVRDAARPEPVVPTFATGSGPNAPIVPIVTGPEPGLPSGTASATSTAEVGAAARVQPIGTSAPRSRGHGRRIPPARATGER